MVAATVAELGIVVIVQKIPANEVVDLLRAIIIDIVDVVAGVERSRSVATRHNHLAIAVSIFAEVLPEVLVEIFVSPRAESNDGHSNRAAFACGNLPRFERVDIGVAN